MKKFTGEPGLVVKYSPLLGANGAKPEKIEGSNVPASLINMRKMLLEDIEQGRFRSVPPNFFDRLNIIACPSCSRVENEKFIELAQEVKRMTAWAEDYALTIAVMGCRVNGPGETDDADLGLWCGPTHVNLKRKTETVGAFTYDEILGRLKRELDSLIESRTAAVVR